MTYSLVEHEAFRPRDDDDDTCPRLLNGLWAEDESHCERCRNLIRSCKPREYAVYDYLGRAIVSDWVDAS